MWNNRDAFQTRHAKGRKPDSKGCTLEGSIEKASYGDRKQTGVVARGGEKGRAKLFGMMGSRTSFRICRAQCKMKMQGPCSKMVKKFKTVRGKHYTKHKALLIP